jgi:hypothetical protein
MTSTLMMERTGTGVQGVGYPGMGTAGMGAPTGVPVGANWLMVPRCTFRLEKFAGGFKCHCVCDDKLACSMVQNLCTMLAGGMCSFCVLQNGMTVCYFNCTQGICKCEPTETGFVFSCASGDQQCGQQIQSCCDCIGVQLQAGCTCCFLINNTPVCCGSSETYAAQQRGKQPQTK